MTDLNIAITREKIEDIDIPQSNNTVEFKEKIKIITIPTIITVPLYSKEISNSLRKIEENYYDFYIFASVQAVNIFFETIKKEENSDNIFDKIKKSNENNNNNFIAIGPKTKIEIEKNNIKAKLAGHFVFDINRDNIDNGNCIVYKEQKIDYSINSVIQFLEIIDKTKTNRKINILMPRSTESRTSNNFISKIYKNVDLEQVFFYKTLECSNVEESEEWIRFKELVINKKLPYLIFTSPSAVRAFFKIISNSLKISKEKEQYKHQIQITSNLKYEEGLLNALGFKLVISLGPKTSEELKKRNIKYIESEDHTIKGALNQLLKIHYLGGQNVE